MMGRTALLADGVLRERAAARELHRRQYCCSWRGRARRRPSRRFGVLGLTPVLVAAATLGVGACAGTAYAVFTATATGTGNATVGVLTAVRVVPATGTPAASLFPGQSAPLRLTLTNPNPRAVTVIAVAQEGTVAVVGGTGCTAADAGVSVPTESSLSITLTPGTDSFTLATGASMATTSASGCQGASFQVPLTVKVRT